MSYKHLRKKKIAAFSLIEVLIASLLMGMMGAIMMRGVNSSVRAKESIEEISSRYQLARQAMTRMSREISMAYLSRHMNTTEPAYVTQFKGYKNRLYFSAFGNVIMQKDAKQSDQHVLGFYIADDKSGVPSLMRRAQPNLNLDVEKGGRAQVLMPNVKKLEFSYYDPRIEKWESEWKSDPSSMTKTNNSSSSGDEAQVDPSTTAQPRMWRLPQYVMIKMTVEMHEGVEVSWTSQASIGLVDPLDLK